MLIDGLNMVTTVMKNKSLENVKNVTQQPVQYQKNHNGTNTTAFAPTDFFGPDPGYDGPEYILHTISLSFDQNYIESKC